MSSSTSTRVFLNKFPRYCKLNLKSVIRFIRLLYTIFAEPIWLLTVVILCFALTFHFSISEPRFFVNDHCFDTEDIYYGGPQLSHQNQMLTANYKSLTSNSNRSQQIQITYSKFKSLTANYKWLISNYGRQQNAEPYSMEYPMEYLKWSTPKNHVLVK